MEVRIFLIGVAVGMLFMNGLKALAACYMTEKKVEVIRRNER